MKKNVFASLVAMTVSLMALTSCMAGSPALSQGTANAGAAPAQSTTGSASDILGSLLGTLIGNAVPVNEQTIVGSWTYTAPEVRFESENFLAQAGGEVAAASIESKLSEIYASIGVKPGTGGFVFNADKTCVITLGAKQINGTYTIDPKTNTINIQSATGLIKLNGKVYFGLGNLALLFDADKILTIAQTLSAFTGKGGSTLGTLGSALGNYKGLMLGMELNKKQ